VREWVETKITPQSPLTFIEPIKGEPIQDGIDYSYIRCEKNPNMAFEAAAARDKWDNRWKYIGIESHHEAMLLAPDRLIEVLQLL
jgi:hypothetical protein